MKLDKMAEHQIKQAQARGELENLKGEGKPFVSGETSNASVEGFGYKTMANAGVLPEEIVLKKEIATLLPTIDLIKDPVERKAQMQHLAELQMRLGIHEEARKKYFG